MRSKPLVGDRVRSLPVVSLMVAAAMISGGCGGTSSGGSAGPTASPTSAIPEPPVSAKPGKPVVTVDGAKVHVEGIGVGISAQFELSGNVAMTITSCAASRTTPFIVLRSAKTNLAPTYVDPVTHLKNLSGKYDVEITPPPACAWTVDFVPE